MYNGESRVWGSHDCQIEPGTSPQMLPVGTAVRRSVVWTGLSTQHIRRGVEPLIDLDRLREVWRAITPASYIHKFAHKEKKSLLIYGAYDTTFLPEFSRQVEVGFRQLGLDHSSIVLPCGHYTMGEAPFKFLDGYHICAFLKRNL